MSGPETHWLRTIAADKDDAIRPAAEYGARPARAAAQPVPGAILPGKSARRPLASYAAPPAPPTPGALMPVHPPARPAFAQEPEEPVPGALGPLPGARESKPSAPAEPPRPARRFTRPPPSMTLDKLRDERRR